jgi:hypothetical protein
MKFRKYLFYVVLFAFIMVVAYLIKSWLGINLLPHRHLLIFPV